MTQKKFSRRDFLRAGALTAAGAALAACCPQPATEKVIITQVVEQEGEQVVVTVETEKIVQATPGPGEVVEITFMGWGATEEDEGVRAAIRTFEGAEPNIKVTWLHTPDNYGEKLLAMLASGTPPDTAFDGSGGYQTDCRDGILLDITEQIKADPVIGAEGYFIEPQETERCTYKGRWYGIGSCWVAPHMYYNADIFEAEGIDPPSSDPAEAWDWDTFVEVCRQLTVDANGNHPGESGFDVNNVERWAVQWPTWSIPLHAAIQSNGGQWIDPATGLLAIDQPEATEALQAIADLMLVHQVMPQNTAFEALGMSNTQMLENGRMAMAVDGSWALAWISKIEATLGTAVLPKMKAPATDMQAHLHVAYKETKHPEEAWRWLRFLATEFYQLQFCKMGLWLPSQTALMTEEGISRWMTLRTAPGMGVHPEGYDKIVADYLPNYGKVLYMPPGYGEADAIITPALDAVWIGDKTAEQAMSEVVADANAILEEEAG
ncbi:MAG: sugar ABC transporter substrate-binding protein [Anaerolineae bacterium]|nr:sugar ABC transporter substrate-binding protein [Anaerolineae bacterium]